MDPQSWLQQQMRYDPTQEERMRYMYELALANPNNPDIVNAYNNAYMQYMMPSPGLFGEQQGPIDLTPDFQTIYGTDINAYNPQMLEEYQRRYGRSGGAFEEIEGEGGARARVFTDALGRPTVIEDQTAQQQAPGVDLWSSSAPAMAWEASTGLLGELFAGKSLEDAIHNNSLNMQRYFGDRTLQGRAARAMTGNDAENQWNKLLSQSGQYR